MKKRTGFTIVEMVITLAILSVAFALSSVAFSNLGRIQSSATDQVVANRELDKLDDLVDEYISLVSLNTSSIKFDYDHVEHGENFITFKEKETDPEYSYTLRFAGSALGYTYDYSGENDYLKKHRGENFKYINDVKFNYDSSLAFLVLNVTYNKTKTINYSYIVRTAL